ncbi:hypothetical protein [Saccharopolyspora sp. ASAGF58]|uniref:hypothetical protein n=1 Tax=Saccharopolyspora sp. ASAGF58 TaxID=2719023 RepID=UPI0014401FD9|nr:hypothetical protein [Saccharopolyspora sp. ASAGF58]QIZ33449.1 hypothetical protein FDZ84_00180 [Saccharopolyspora sp. ASAGF58]
MAELARPFVGEGGDGWEGLAREVGLDVGRDDFREALKSLAELAWDVGFDGRKSAPVYVSRMKLLRVLIDAGFEDGRQGAAFYDRTVGDLRELVADLAEPVFNHVTGQREKPRPENVSDDEIRRWIEPMELVHYVGGYRKLVGEIGADLVSGRRLLRVVRVAYELYDENPDMATLRSLAWLASQLDPVSSNISLSSLAKMVARFERRDGGAFDSEVRDLVKLAGRARDVLGRLDSVQVDADADGDQQVRAEKALEAMWKADKRWRRVEGRLAGFAIPGPARDEQTVQWARGLAGFEDARAVVVREPAESQALLDAVVLTPFVTGIAEWFGGDWGAVAAEVGLGDVTNLPADYRESLLNLAALHWDTQPILLRNAVPVMRRLRLLIDAGLDDGREGAARYARTVDDLRALVAELPVFDPQTGRQLRLRSTRAVGDVEIYLWLDRMDVVHDLGGVGAVVGAVGADLVGGRRFFPVITLAQQLYGQNPDMATLRSLAWLASQLDPVSSNISWLYLAKMVARFEGRGGRAFPSEVRDLVSLAERARLVLGRLDSVQADADAYADGDQQVGPEKALEAMWKADKRWRRVEGRLATLAIPGPGRDEQTVRWARGLLAGFEDARAVVVREPAESQARLNAVVLTPFVTRIAEGFGGDWRAVAAEVGLGDVTNLPADYRESLLNLAALYWETEPILFDNAVPVMRRLRLLIDAGLSDGREGAARYARTVDELRSLVADLRVFELQAGRQQHLRSPGPVTGEEIRSWLWRMDLVHDLGGVGAVVGAVGADLVGGRRFLPVIALAQQLYNARRPGMATLRGLAWLASRLDPVSSNISPASLARMAADFEGREDWHGSLPEMHRLVELAGIAREDGGQVDGDPVQALKAMWNADKPWQRIGYKLAALAHPESRREEQTVQWARGLLIEFEEARSVVVREPAESQARLNAVVLTPFVTRIAEGFGGDWGAVAAEVGLGTYLICRLITGSPC